MEVLMVELQGICVIVMGIPIENKIILGLFHLFI